MRVCFFGIFDEGYARNRVLIEGFKRNGHDVTLCKIDPKGKGVISKYWELYKEYKKISSTDFDYVIVAFPGHTVVWLAYLLWGRDIVFDVFVSLYNSEVEDRAYHSLISPRAFYYWFLDWYSMRLPKRLIMETDVHIEFLEKKFGVPQKKFVKVYVGSDDKRVYPTEGKKNDMFTVVFHGTGIPLQGIPYIIDAARILPDAHFVLWGAVDNFVFKKVIEDARGLDNIEFRGAFDRDKINEVISESDVMLGIFGDTQKTQLVVPNKAYETWASRKPLISADTPGMRELVEDGEQVVLCKVADGKSLAEKIVYLRDNPDVREKIAERGYTFYRHNLLPEVLVKQLIEDLKHAQ